MKKQTFGQWLKAQRRMHTYTQRQVEEAIGIDHSQYSKWENDHNQATPETRAKFHEFYGTSEEDLVALGILESYVTLDGTTHYFPAEHLTDADREAEAAHRAFEGRPAPIRADDPRVTLMDLLAGASDDEVWAVVNIVTIMQGGIAANRAADAGAADQQGAG